MSDIEDLADEMPNLKGDPCERGGAHRAAIANGRRLLAKFQETQRKQLAEGNRLRMSEHTPSLPKLKFMSGDK